MIATGLVGLSAPAQAGQAADQTEMHTSDVGIQSHQYSWGPVTRNCSSLSNYSCIVRATGGDGWQYHKRNGTTVRSWDNNGTVARSSSHGPGSQQASVVAHTSLSNASATCTCVASPCPV
jgi:hypothetical protein